MSDKLDNLEKKFEKLKDDSSAGPSRPRKVRPNGEVRDLVRKIYRALSEDEDCCWDPMEGLMDGKNKPILEKVVQEAKLQLNDTPVAIIKDAAKTYFRSLTGVGRLKQNGKYLIKCARQRRKNRQLRKLKRRQAALAKTTSVNEDQKKHWGATLILDLQSSEESNSESEKATFIVKTLPWRSSRVTSFFHSLDMKHTKNASKRSCKMAFSRQVGADISDRPRPTGIPSWMLAK